MNTRLKLFLNTGSVSMLLLSIIGFVAYALYTSDLQRREQVLHRQTAKFILTLIDERVAALDKPEASGFYEDVLSSISDYFDETDSRNITVFKKESGKILYPFGVAERSVEEEVLRSTVDRIEGEISLSDRFGYFVRYERLGVVLFISSYTSQLFFFRNQLIYTIVGVVLFFTVVLFLVESGALKRWNRFIKEMKSRLQNSIQGESLRLEAIEGWYGGDLDEVLNTYNGMISKVRKLIERFEARVQTLFRQRDRLKKLVLLYRKYVQNDTLLKISTSNVSDIVDTRKEVCSLTIELLDFLKPINDLYPQVITSELNGLHNFLKEETARNGGIINFSHGYVINIVYGAPFSVDDPFQRAVLGSKKLLHWVEERNRSNLNKSGVHWEPKMGLSFGTAVSGTVGESFVVIGKVVEKSEELMEHAKYYGVSLVTNCSEILTTLKGIKYRKLDVVKEHDSDKSYDETIHEIFLREPEMLDEGVKLYYHGLDMFYEGKYDVAANYFRKVIAIFNGDNPSNIFLARCNKILRS